MEFQPPRHVMIIEAYLEGRLTLQAAAQELVSALDDTAVNVSMTPKVRTLLAEVHRLRTGEPPASSPPFTADPNRHKDGLQFLDGLQEWLWETLAKYDHPTRLDCSFHAATKQAA